MKNMTDKYQNNPLMRFWMGPTLFIFVNDPKLIEQVLNSPKCIDKSFIYKFLRLDKGLLAANRKFNGHFLCSVILKHFNAGQNLKKCLFFQNYFLVIVLAVKLALLQCRFNSSEKKICLTLFLICGRAESLAENLKKI